MTDETPTTNGEFKGGVSARLANIEHALERIGDQLDLIHGRVTGVRETLASARTQIGVLWGAAGVIAATVIGVVIKLLIGGAQ